MSKFFKHSILSALLMNAEVGASGSTPVAGEVVKQEEKPTTKSQPMADGRVLYTYPQKFRSKKEKQKGPDGKEIEVKVQRESFDVSVALHTQETLLEIMAGEDNSVKDFIVETMNELLKKAVKEQADDKPEATNFGDLDNTKFTLSELAKEAASGSSGKPEKEMFEAFCAHYIKTMPAVAGVSTDAAKNAASEFMMGKFTKTAYIEAVLKTHQNRLNTFVKDAPDADQFEDVTTWLLKKVAKLIEALSGGTEY
jgi:hypothetical protein